MRHPSETGQPLVALGASLLLASRWSAAWLVLVILPLTLLRLGQEEAVLAAGLAEYDGYRRQVDGLLPLCFLVRAVSPVKE